MQIPDPEYVKTEDGVYIAYQVVGEGPVDVIWQQDFASSLDVCWESPWDRRWFEGLAKFGRLILHDRRGCGLSSRNVALPNLETRVHDLRTVLDAAGSTSAVMGAWFESLAPCLLLAASDPSRVRALVWWNPTPRTLQAPDYPWGHGPDDVAHERESLKHWGTAEYGRRWAEEFEKFIGFRPPEDAVRWQAKLARSTCTPDVAVKLNEIWWETDVRGVLPAVRTPTLLIVGEDEGDSLVVAEHVDSLMPDARIEVFPMSRWPTSRDEIERDIRPKLEALQRLVGIGPRHPAIDTILATVLFTDIVNSTETQAALHDHRWKELIEAHQRDRAVGARSGGAESRTTPPVTASSPPSTAPLAPSAVPWRSSPPWGWLRHRRFGPECTPASAS